MKADTSFSPNSQILERDFRRQGGKYMDVWYQFSGTSQEMNLYRKGASEARSDPRREMGVLLLHLGHPGCPRTWDN